MFCIENKLLFGNIIWSRQREKRASKLIPVSMQNLQVIRILFKKVVSFHLLIFWDGRCRTHYFHLKSQECFSVSVYKSFQNNIYVSHISCILNINWKEMLCEAFIWSTQKRFQEDHHFKVVFWFIFASNTAVECSAHPCFLSYSTYKNKWIFVQRSISIRWIYKVL